MGNASDKFNKAVESLKKGLEINGYVLIAKKVSKGRFPEELVLQIYIKKENHEARLLRIRVYRGYDVHYRPWVEFSKIEPEYHLGEERIRYFNSPFEDRLMKVFSEEIPPGGKLYIEYVRDRETGEGLLKGFPVTVTRLGNKFLELGFTWFKDWYFPEGGLEGGEKLQGEKPLDEKNKKRHLKTIEKDVKAFHKKIQGSDMKGLDLTTKKAYERAEKFLSSIS